MDGKQLDLPTISTQEARHLFLAMYQTTWGTHPAAKTFRQDDNVARLEREMWGAVIDRIAPEDFKRVIADVKAVLAGVDRKGKPTLEDFEKSARRLYGPRTAFMERSPQYMLPEDRPVSRREYLQANEHKHPGSATFALLWKQEFGKPWGGYSPPATVQAEPRERIGAVDIESALDPVEQEERKAIREEEPW